MRFWDTSALLPLFIAEPRTSQALAWLRVDSKIVVWTLTRVEALSALARRKRDHSAPPSELASSRAAFIRAYDDWSQIDDVASVRRHAERLVETHHLRAGDAIQLGAAIAAAEDDPSNIAFVTFDVRLALAAEKEGFRVFGPR